MERGNDRGLKLTEQVMKVLERIVDGLIRQLVFVDPEKVFDQMPRKVIWMALRKLRVEEWIVRLVQGMYAYARSCDSEEFEVKVDVHQDSVL